MNFQCFPLAPGWAPRGKSLQCADDLFMGELCIVLTEGVVGQDWTSQSFYTMHRAAAFQAVLCPESLCIPLFLVVYGTPKRN